MEKKYELIKEDSIVHKGKTLYRIRALRDIICRGKIVAKAGELGGYIEQEKNLSQKGAAWVGGNAKVCDFAEVYDDAEVRDYAEVYGHAKVHGNAKVCDFAEVYNYAEVCGYTLVSSIDKVRDMPKICVFADDCFFYNFYDCPENVCFVRKKTKKTLLESNNSMT